MHAQYNYKHAPAGTSERLLKRACVQMGTDVAAGGVSEFNAATPPMSAHRMVPNTTGASEREQREKETG